MPSPLDRLLPGLVAFLVVACGEEGGGGSALVPAPRASAVSPPGPAADPSAPARAARETAPTVSAARVEGPALRFAKEKHEFGEASDTRILRCAYAFENVGTEPVVISRIKPSCGCMTTRLSKMCFEPGEGAELELEWKPLGRGRQTKGLTVHSTAFPGGFHRLFATCEVRPFVRVEPPLVYFGEVEMGKEHTLRATLTCEDPSFVIESIACPNPHVAVAVVEDTSPGPRAIEVTVRESAPWGQVVGKVTVRVRGRVPPGDGEVVHDLSFNTHARVFGDLRTDKTMFAVGKVSPGAKFRYEVRLTRASGEPFRLLDLGVDNSQPPGMTVAAEPLAAGGYKMVLTGASGSYRGYVRGQVRFATDVPGEPARRLAIAGNVAE
ncbi:MAG: DUF1573 domain-containing protein [Planctomycetota bacterium]|jgi:hypothetical protein|nr:DUF1573 domain-containing protein [Planctomycetota bacterium]